MTYLNDEQVKLLLRPIHPRRVLQRDGMSYVEGYDIRAELNRVFGFGRWSEEILDQGVVCETSTKTKAGKDAWYVVYRTRIRLTVCAPDGTELTRYDGSHVGESTHPVRGEAHGNALTNSETYALRRCAINLGDQFGLSLYNKGSLDAIVRWTLVRPEQEAEAGTTDTDDVPQVSAESPVSGVSAEDEGAGEAFDDGEPVEVAHAPRDVSEPEVADEARMGRKGGAGADAAWLDGALKAAPKLASLEACTALWNKSAEKVADGTCTRAGAAKLQDILRKRAEKLKAAPPVAASLDPDDPWTAAIEGMAGPGDGEALLQDVADQRGRGEISPERAAVIEGAIEQAIAGMESRAAA